MQTNGYLWWMYERMEDGIDYEKDNAVAMDECVAVVKSVAQFEKVNRG